MAKAILVTETNKNRLEVQYGLDNGNLDEMVGLYLVADFGDNTVYKGFLTKEKLDELYETTGKELKNDYFEVI